MPIGSVVIYLAIALLALAESRSRGGRWRTIAFVALGGLAVLVILEEGIDTGSLLHVTPVFDLVAASLALLIAIDLVGLPLPLARRLHLGLHSREWEFDRRLTALLQEAYRAVDDHGSGVPRRGRELPSLIAEISALRAPDPDWARVRDEWADAWQHYLDLPSEPVDAAARDKALALHRELTERTGLLRLRYRSDASRILGKGS